MLFWLVLSIIAIAGAVVALRRRRGYESPEAEPWRASMDDAGEPLDWDEAAIAEEEFHADSWGPEEEDDDWVP